MYEELKKIPGLLRFVIFVVDLRKKVDIFIYNKIYLPNNLKRIKKKISKGEKVNVFFSAWNIPMWKYHSLYMQFSKDNRFNTAIILCPSPTKDSNTRKKDLEEMKRVFEKRGYNIYPIVQDDNDIKFKFDKKLRKNIDIFFPTQQYSPYHLEKGMKKYIYCYANYGYHNVKVEKWVEDTFLYGIIWKAFIENETVLKDIRDVVPNKGRNRVVTGFIYGDELLNNKHNKKVWKDDGHQRKKIIWAPHHTVNKDTSVLDFSNFYETCDFMLEMASKYKDMIQIAFKPHPFLYNALCESPTWGKEKADAYYNKWNYLENGQLELGEYADLFVTSDAMIHDCGSFVVEYLYVNKPVLYISSNINDRSKDSIATAALKAHYKATTKSEIEEFIVNVVLGGNDTLGSERDRFFSLYLLPPNGLKAGVNAYNEIVNSLI